MNRSTPQGVLLAFLAYSAYAVSDASVKMLHGSLSAYEAVFFGALSGVVALPLVRRRGERLDDVFRARNRGMWFVRVGAALTGSVGSVTAFTHLSMAEAFSLLFLMPTFVTILSVIFLKEPVGWRRWGAVLLGFAGVLIVLRPGFRELNIGHLGAVVGGLSGALTVVTLRRFGQSETRMSLYGASLIGPTVGGGLLMLPDFIWPSPIQWVWLLGYGLLMALANILVMLASARIPASLVAPAQYSQMLWAIALGYLVFGDGLDATMALGVAVIILSGILTFMREKVRKPQGWRRVPPTHPR
ncbi:Permease of the drug/metabolite transporter (DMT) superfamily [Roseomonas rosea]|uniref:Permease of the drug/metabolite transporter (DMT) superfamily n=1 Tax=Muricoccus roseus TaxID=198092 RepID=A0A1M6NVG4_9PROT|nr:DMT family transporter [Roseomonas rosea]SHJ99628.1 Permease of the drug/metabolite transporter (DMT) superfamily [Roseomonas rosea]